MLYNSVRSDLSFLDKKMKLGRDSRNCRRVCLDEQTSHAQIPHWGYMLMPGRAPIHIDTRECLDSRMNHSRRGSLSLQNVFNGAGLVKVCIRSVVLRESRRDAPPPSIPRRKAFPYSPPQSLNISDRKRLLSAGYPTLTRIAISIRGHPRTVVFGLRPSTRHLDAPVSQE
jgi:hypothetical protein